MTTVYWSTLTSENWKVNVAATDKGLCYIETPNKSCEELEAWVRKKIPKAILEKNNQILQPYMKEIIQYLEGERNEFTFSYDLRGTPFQLAVWDASTKIPYGETRTYAEIAQQINNPKAVRAVGAAIGANPVLFAIPCHRIVAKSGSLAGFRAGLDVKQKLLELEKHHTSPNV